MLAPVAHRALATPGLPGRVNSGLWVVHANALPGSQSFSESSSEAFRRMHWKYIHLTSHLSMLRQHHPLAKAGYRFDDMSRWKSEGTLLIS